MMLRVTDDATDDEIREAIGHLRAKQLRCEVDTVRAEVGVVIDELLDRLGR